jgi:hypothetical protein
MKRIALMATLLLAPASASEACVEVAGYNAGNQVIQNACAEMQKVSYCRKGQSSPDGPIDLASGEQRTTRGTQAQPITKIFNCPMINYRYECKETPKC